MIRGIENTDIIRDAVEKLSYENKKCVIAVSQALFFAQEDEIDSRMKQSEKQKKGNCV